MTKSLIFEEAELWEESAKILSCPRIASGRVWIRSSDKQINKLPAN